MKKVAVIQSNYIPWKGYFDIIHDCGLFIFHDDLQYTKNDWRNRNKIKTPSGPAWLTIPVGNREGSLICEVELKNTAWAARHWRILEHNYSKAPFFNEYKAPLKNIYFDKNTRLLSQLNQNLIIFIARELLGIKTEIADSRDFSPSGKKLDRLLGILKNAGAGTYISGPTAKQYIDPEDFERAGIKLKFKDYEGYPQYEQFHPPFTHHISILDLLFHTGPDAPYYIWGWRSKLKPREQEPPAETTGHGGTKHEK